MIRYYDPGQLPRRSPPEAFLNQIEASRYAFLAEMFRDLDRPVLAQMCQNWMKEHRAAADALARTDARLDRLDAVLRGDAA